MRWSCDQRTRELFLSGRRDDGGVETTKFTLRTPSCRDRLELRAPRRVKPGGAIPVTVTDTWGTGLTTASVCLSKRCRTLDLADGQATATTTFTARHRGITRAILRAPSQVVSAPVAVGVRPPPPADAEPTVVTTGDSMMQSLDAILSDRLAGAVEIASDVHPGTGISSSAEGWYAAARKQVAASHPEATVVFLGANDLYPMQIRSSDRVEECCGRRWEAEYARRARRLMRIYARRGAGTVLWLSLPIMRDPRRGPPVRAVNAALRKAASQVSTAHVLRTDRILTPGGRFRGFLRFGGRRVRVREPDGIHLSVPGARIAATAVTEFLHDAGIY